MADNFDTTPVTFGEFAYLADNYHWDSQEDALKRFKALVGQSQFPLFPDSLSVIVCKTGRFDLTSSGTVLSAGPKSALVVLGGQPIEAFDVSPDCRILFFSGKSRHFDTQIDLDDANRILRHALELRHPFLFQLTSKEFSAIEKLYFSAKELLQLSPEKTKGGIVAGYARIVSTLLAARLQYGDTEEIAPVGPANHTLLPAFLDNVRQHCRRERGVIFYSNLANLTPKYFSKQIKQLSGKSPGNIIEEFTMTEAKSLLASKKYSVKEVSIMMNFSSPSSFCKYFKAAEGCTPGQYMKHG